MNKAQLEIACQIIDLDCTGQGELKDGMGKFCAIGGLYAAIDPDWAASAKLETGKLQMEHYKEVEVVFGINTTPIHVANDGIKSLTRRRVAVKAALTVQLEE